MHFTMATRPYSPNNSEINTIIINHGESHGEEKDREEEKGGGGGGGKGGGGGGRRCESVGETPLSILSDIDGE